MKLRKIIAGFFAAVIIMTMFANVAFAAETDEPNTPTLANEEISTRGFKGYYTAKKVGSVEVIGGAYTGNGFSKLKEDINVWGEKTLEMWVIPEQPIEGNQELVYKITEYKKDGTTYTEYMWVAEAKNYYKHTLKYGRKFRVDVAFATQGHFVQDLKFFFQLSNN